MSLELQVARKEMRLAHVCCSIRTEVLMLMSFVSYLDISAP
jgi:hypothetical protein